jgi:hypothetical protein
MASKSCAVDVGVSICVEISRNVCFDSIIPRDLMDFIGIARFYLSSEGLTPFL